MHSFHKRLKIKAQRRKAQASMPPLDATPSVYNQSLRGHSKTSEKAVHRPMDNGYPDTSVNSEVGKLLFVKQIFDFID